MGIKKSWLAHQLFCAALVSACAYVFTGGAGAALSAKARTLSFDIDPGAQLAGYAAGLSSEDLQQVDCLARNMYFEGRDQGEEGMRAITDVVFNRIAKPEYPGTACEVITEPGQFSWYEDGRDHVMRDKQAAKEVYRIALDAWLHYPGPHYKPQHHDLTGGATRYHAFYVNPKWHSWKQTIQIGAHIFYKPKEPQS